MGTKPVLGLAGIVSLSFFMTGCGGLDKPKQYQKSPTFAKETDTKKDTNALVNQPKGGTATGTGTGPHRSQRTTGIGQPQARWREIEKSLAR